MYLFQDFYWLISLAVGMLVTGLVIGCLVHARLKTIHQQAMSVCHGELALAKEKNDTLQQVNGQLQDQLTHELQQVRQSQLAYSELQAAHAAVQAREQRIPMLEKEVAQWQARSDQLQIDLRREAAALAQAVEKGARLEKLEVENSDKDAQLAALAQTRTQSAAAIAELSAVLAEERKHAAEKLALLIQAREQMKSEFENLAQQIFEEKGRKFNDQNRIAVDHLIAPLREQIGEFKKRVEDVYDKETRDRTALHAEIHHLKELNQQVSKEAVNLTRALKGDSKTRGNWGEVVLERVLESSGLQKGREYEVQVSLRDEHGKRSQPDVIVHLPEGKDVVIDAKVSLKDYEIFFSSEEPIRRAEALSAHVNAIRSHISGLAAKSYAALEGVRSLDFVLMFVPIEAAFLAAVEKDCDLFGEAFDKSIIVVSPATLLVTLRTIESIWRHEYQNRHALEIARKAGALYDKFVGFVAALEEVGLQLDRAKESYCTAYDRLTSGRGNLVKRSQELKTLGVKAGKELSRKLLEREGENNASS